MNTQDGDKDVLFRQEIGRERGGGGFSIIRRAE
jgi:hypothetical protein